MRSAVNTFVCSRQSLLATIAMAYLVSLIATVSVVIFFYIYVRIRQFLEFRYHMNKFPGPYSYYIFGNAFLICGTSGKSFK